MPSDIIRIWGFIWNGWVKCDQLADIVALLLEKFQANPVCGTGWFVCHKEPHGPLHFPRNYWAQKTLILNSLPFKNCSQNWLSHCSQPKSDQCAWSLPYFRRNNPPFQMLVRSSAFLLPYKMYSTTSDSLLKWK